MAWPQSTTGLPYTRTDHTTNPYYKAEAHDTHFPNSSPTSRNVVNPQRTVFAGQHQYNTKVTEGSQFPSIGAYLHSQPTSVVNSVAQTHITKPENTVDYKQMVERLGQYVKEQSQYTAIPFTVFTFRRLRQIFGCAVDKSVAQNAIPKIYLALTHYSKEQPEMLGAMCLALNLLLDHIEDSNNNFSWEYRETVRMLKAYLKGGKPVRQKVSVDQVKLQQTNSPMPTSQSAPILSQAGSVIKPYVDVWQCPRKNSALMSANECVKCLSDVQVLAVLDVIKAYDKRFVRPEQAVMLLKDFNIYTSDFFRKENICVSELLERIESSSSNRILHKRAFLSRLFEYVSVVKTARGLIHNDSNIVLIIGKSFMYKGNNEQQLIRWLSGGKLTADDFVTDEQRQAIQQQREQEPRGFVTLPSKMPAEDQNWTVTSTYTKSASYHNQVKPTVYTPPVMSMPQQHSGCHNSGYHMHTAQPNTNRTPVVPALHRQPEMPIQRAAARGAPSPAIKNTLPATAIPKGSPVILNFSGKVMQWKFLARYLELYELYDEYNSAEVIEEIEHDYKNHFEQSYQFLVKWVEIAGKHATWAAVGKALLDNDQADLYETLKEEYDKYEL